MPSFRNNFNPLAENQGSPRGAAGEVTRTKSRMTPNPPPYFELSSRYNGSSSSHSGWSAYRGHGSSSSHSGWSANRSHGSSSSHSGWSAYRSHGSRECADCRKPLSKLSRCVSCISIPPSPRSYDLCECADCRRLLSSSGTCTSCKTVPSIGKHGSSTCVKCREPLSSSDICAICKSSKNELVR